MGRDPQLALGVDAQVARQVDDREQQVAHLARERGVGVAAQLLLDLARLLVDLGEGAGRVGPVEADRSGLLLHAVGRDQRGQALRLLAQQRGGAVAAFFELLDLLPLAVGRLAIANLGLAVDVRMPADQLSRRPLQAFREIGASPFTQQLEAEDC